MGLGAPWKSIIYQVVIGIDGSIIALELQDFEVSRKWCPHMLSSNGGSLLSPSFSIEERLWIILIYWSSSLSFYLILRSRSIKAFDHCRDRWSRVKSCFDRGLWACFPLRFYEGTCNCSSGRGVAPTTRHCVAGGNTSIGYTIGWEAIGGATGKSWVAEGGAGVAWMAWTTSTKLWTYVKSILSWSILLATICDGG